MPRKAKRTQAPDAPEGLPYGERGDLIEAQQEVPMGRPEQPGLTSGAAQATPSDIAAAQATPFAEVGLFGPSQRPDQGILDGVGQPIGPAAPSLATMLEVAAVETGDATLMAAADRARAQGL